MAIEAEGSLIAFLGVDHHSLDAALKGPIEAVHDEVGADALAAVAGIYRKSLQVATVASAPGHGVAEDGAALHHNGELAARGGTSCLAQRGFIEAPEVVESAAVDVEHRTTMPRPTVSNGSGWCWWLVVERAGEQMQPLEQPKTAIEERLCVEERKRRGDSAFDAPGVELLDTVDDIVDPWTSTVACWSDQCDEPIPLPGHDA